MYKLKPAFLRRGPLRVAVVGVGGTGSEIVSGLTNLHLGLLALGKPGLHVVAFDPDVVSAANIVRQRYAPADIGLPKAHVLIHRINLVYNLGWEAVQSRFTSALSRDRWDLVISCVDSKKSRNELHRFAFAQRFRAWGFWLDTGNDRTTGQIVLGTPRLKPTPSNLPCATELHPELMDLTIPEDDAPSCSAIESLSRQDLMTNKMVATLAIDLLWRLFRDESLRTHACYFDLTSSSLSARAVPVPAKARRTRSTAQNAA
jgi:PRTRC genetic system ThiF family protein